MFVYEQPMQKLNVLYCGVFAVTSNMSW